MEYNDLINNLLDNLDNLEVVKEIKKLKKNLVKNQLLINDINTYRLVKTIKNKEKLYQYPDYVKYLKCETEINLLINNIKKKFNFFNRCC